MTWSPRGEASGITNDGTRETSGAFKMIVGIDIGGSTTDAVLLDDEIRVVTVEANDPPDCSAAAASIAELWPPNHKFRTISIVGVTDPDGDPVSITIDGVTQDEPLDGPGDGSTCPDAEIDGDDVRVRSERSGLGNGRVYAISFTYGNEESYARKVASYTESLGPAFSRSSTEADSAWTVWRDPRTRFELARIRGQPERLRARMSDLASGSR